MITRSGRVMTVTGEIESDRLGVTLAHEHVIADIRSLLVKPFHESRAVLIERDIEEVDRALLLRDPLVSRDNCILGDEIAAAAELNSYRKAGGLSVVECTSIGLGRNIRALARVAANTSVNIIAPTGFYLWHSLSEDVRSLGEEELVKIMRSDIMEGIDGTDIRAGVIGEIGTSRPLHAFEERVLKAAAAVHVETGVPIAVHLDQTGREADRVIQILVDGGVDLGRVVMGHLDQRPDMDRGYIRHIASSGAFLGLDTFGTTFAYDSMGFSDPTDTQRIELARDLVEAGLADQIVFSHDVGMKCMLRRHGGGGYAHLVADLWPAMVKLGIPEDVVRACFTDNPARWLARNEQQTGDSQ